MDADPKTPCGKSKLQAELKLAEIQSTSSIDIIQLINLTSKYLPLPLSALSAKRHYLYIENLFDFVEHCLTSNVVSTQPLFLADEEAVIFGELLRALSLAQGRRPFEIPFPSWFLSKACKLVLSAKSHRQIFHNSFIDSTNTFQLSNWKPKHSTIEGIYQMFGKSP